MSLATAARAVAEMGGGLAVADGEHVLASPAAARGRPDERPPRAGGARRPTTALLAGRPALGSPLHDPFMAMSFMALEVIPKLKLTDQGLVDVEKFAFVDLFVTPES